MPGTNGHPAYPNRRTHWWDVSFVYGSDAETENRTRTREGGKIYAGVDGIMGHNIDGVISTGDNKNSWVGVSLLQVRDITLGDVTLPSPRFLLLPRS